MTLAAAQLTDRRFIRVFLLATSLALVLLAGLAWLLITGVSAVTTTGWPAWLATAWEWLDAALAVIGSLAVFYFLFPAVATGVMSVFLDSVVDAVEERHYPRHAATRSPGIMENIRLGLRSALRLIGYNLLALPLYMVLLFTAIGPMVLFLTINSFLLGRDLTEMVAVRHFDRAQETTFYNSHRWLPLKVGLVTSLAFLVPVLNLFAPLLGAAVATHAFHNARGHRPVA